MRAFHPLLLAVALSACRIASDPGTPAEDAKDGVPADETDVPSDPPLSETGVAALGLRGQLAAPDGGVLAGVQVLGCTTTVCIVAASDAEGRFVLEMPSDAPMAVKVRADLDRQPRRAALLRPCPAFDPADHDLGRLPTYALPEGVPIGWPADAPQALAVADDLTLHTRRADLQPPLGETLVDAAAVRLPESAVPALGAWGPADVVAAWALHPFGATARAPVGVEARVALPDGPASVWTLSDLDGSPLGPARAEVVGGVLRTLEGEGLPSLTWMVVTVP